LAASLPRPWKDEAYSDEERSAERPASTDDSSTAKSFHRLGWHRRRLGYRLHRHLDRRRHLERARRRKPAMSRSTSSKNLGRNVSW